jgi:fucose 4-O-acetylase-like acetyltransferase
MDRVLTNTEISSKRERLSEVDRGTAIAIILVVIGHIVAREPPQGNEWYVFLKYSIYKFHMPVFMFLSGIIFQYTFNYIKDASTFIEGIKKKFYRLMPGFILYGSLIIFGKVLASEFMHVDNLQMNILDAYYKLLITPMSSPSGSLWYIYALFILYLIVPMLYRVFSKSLMVLLIFAVLLHIFNNLYQLPPLFMLNAVAEYLMWFVMGALTLGNYQLFLKLFNKYRVFIVAVFLLSFVSIEYVSEPFSKSIISLTAIPAILSVTKYTKFDKFLMPISEYTFSIYLMNTIIIGALKGVMLHIAPWNGANFYIYFPLLMLAGILGPILVHKYALKYLPYISSISK